MGYGYRSVDGAYHSSESEMVIANVRHFSRVGRPIAAERELRNLSDAIARDESRREASAYLDRIRSEYDYT